MSTKGYSLFYIVDAMPANPALLPKAYTLPNEARLHQIIDQLLTSQTNEDGVAVTAQWVLSLNNNCSYLVQTPHAANNTFQVNHSIVQTRLWYCITAYCVIVHCSLPYSSCYLPHCFLATL